MICSYVVFLNKQNELWPHDPSSLITEVIRSPNRVNSFHRLHQQHYSVVLHQWTTRLKKRKEKWHWQTYGKSKTVVIPLLERVWHSSDTFESVLSKADQTCWCAQIFWQLQIRLMSICVVRWSMEQKSSDSPFNCCQSAAVSSLIAHQQQYSSTGFTCSEKLLTWVTWLMARHTHSHMCKHTEACTHIHKRANI